MACSGIFKHTPGDPCCEGCCLLEEDLPTLSIVGMTGSAWSESLDCCWNMTFTPDEPSEITEYSDDLIDATRDVHYEIREIWKHPPKRIYLTSADPIPSELTDPDLCCVDLIDAGTRVVDILLRTKKRFKIVVSYGNLDVTLSLMRNTCLEGDMVCRPVITIVQHITYEIYLETLEYSYEHVVSQTLDACFELDDGGTSQDYENEIGSISWGAGPTSSVLVASGSAEIRKHKWFDSFPLPATIDFATGDTPFSECGHDLCHQLDESDDQVCFTSDSLDITPEFPDFCDQTNSTDPLDYEFGAAEENLQPACPASIDVPVYTVPCEDPPTVVIEDIPLNVTCDDIFEVTTDFPSSFVTRIDNSCCKTYTDPCGTDEVVCPDFYKMAVDVFERSIDCQDNTSTVELCVESTPSISVS